MASLYPSLEDFKYDVLMNNGNTFDHHLNNNTINNNNNNNNSSAPILLSSATNIRQSAAALAAASAFNNNNLTKYSNDSGIYPTFNHYMGLHLDTSDLHSISARSSAVSVPGKHTSIVAPLSGDSQAYKLQPSNTIRLVILCKDGSNKVGLRLAPVQGGVFVVLVHAKSPAALAGIRFGDQVLEINDIPVAGFPMHKVHDIFRKAHPDNLRLVVRDRPFERTITLHKDEFGSVGFMFGKHGKIVSIVKDSSAARNGLLIEHNILEINGQNVVAMDTAEVRKVMENCGNVVILTIVPSKIYEHMIKQTSLKLLRKVMDHSVPEF